MKMEREINTRFNVSGGWMTVVEVEENVCDGCFYEAENGHSTCVNVRGGECIGYLRKDRKNVIFKPIKK